MDKLAVDRGPHKAPAENGGHGSPASAPGSSWVVRQHEPSPGERLAQRNSRVHRPGWSLEQALERDRARGSCPAPTATARSACAREGPTPAACVPSMQPGHPTRLRRPLWGRRLWNFATRLILPAPFPPSSPPTCFLSFFFLLEDPHLLSSTWSAQHTLRPGRTPQADLGPSCWVLTN